MNTAVAARKSITRVLCVDMDGTLLATDVLWESLLILFKSQPWHVPSVIVWLLKGRASFKAQLARCVLLNPKDLPYRQDVLAFLQQEKQAGRDIILATASDRSIAEAVANHVGLFSTILASDGKTNLSGVRKLNAVATYAGEDGFDYVGDAKADLAVWKAAHQAMVVHPSLRLLRKIGRVSTVARVFAARGNEVPVFLQALRVYQWLKNLLLFVPLLLAHQLNNPPRVFAATYAFCAFCLCCSGVYVLNDLLDLSADRNHPQKRLRPFASGLLPIIAGVGLAPLLIGLSLGLSMWLLSPFFVITLMLYLTTAFAYSAGLKRFPILDVLLLAGLYSLRILAGTIATKVDFSQWLIAFSIFFFFSLALVKRWSELKVLSASGKTAALGRGYLAADGHFLQAIGIVSGYLSVLVLSLYMNSREVTALYRHPDYLWLICPLLLYWITRVWFIAHRKIVDEDPIIFAAKDPASYLIAAAIGLLIMTAL